MLRTWKMLALQALFATSLTAAPALAETSGPLTDSEKLTEIQKQLNDMRKSLAELEKAVPALEKKVDSLRSESNLSSQTGQGQIGDLKLEVDRLRNEVEGLRSRLPGTSRVSAYPPPESDAPASGRVVMINTYPQEMTVVLNRRAYRIPPGETRISDPIAAGSFTYEVLGVSESRTRTLLPNQAFTILVHPQP